MSAESTIALDDDSQAYVLRQRRGLRHILMLAAPVVVIIGALYSYVTGGCGSAGIIGLGRRTAPH